MGGSCSKCCVTVVSPMIVSFDQIPTPTTKSNFAISTRIVESCIVIWLFDDPSKKFEPEKEHLRRLVYNLQVFTNLETCVDYIRGIRDEKLFLITSVTYQSLVNVYQLSSLERIYIFDPFSPDDDNQRHERSNIFRDMNHLSKQLQEDIECCELDLICISAIANLSDEIKSSMTLTKEQASFVFIQMITEIMARLKYDSNAKNVLVDFCRIHYANNDEQLQMIDQFAKYYRPNTAFEWLKRPCFISNMLNRAKRTREIDILYKLGFFIKHLNMQLTHLHEQNASLLKNISMVYRGKTMTSDEFECLIKKNCSGLLSFSNFLGTSVNRGNTVEFIRRRLAIHPDATGIVFEIDLDHTIVNEETPFALLKSNDPTNGEVYFDSGTVFRIDSIESMTDNLLVFWCVRLKLIRNDDPQLLRVLTPFRNHELHENPLSFLGKLLMDMEEYRRVEQFFLEMLNDTSILSQPRRLVRARNGLGANYMHKRDYGTALMHYEEALQVSLTYLPPDHSDLVSIYKNIADCYFNQQNYSQALENYEQAIRVIENNRQSSKASMLTELQTLVSTTKHLIANNKPSLLTSSKD